MSELEFQIVRSGAFVLALGLAASLQHWFPFATMRESLRVNGSLWAVNLVVVGLLCGACACTVSRWAEAKGFGLGLGAEPAWVAIPVSILALDLVSYGWHRANHVLPFLWRFHQVHHSDQAFTTTTALRFHPGELLLSFPLRLSAVALLGVPVVAIIVFEAVFSFANFVEHGNIRLHLGLERSLSRVFVTPALHRRHHSRERALLDTNFATIFSFWDRLFGSFGPSSSDVAVRVGLPGAGSVQRPWAALALPARQILQGE